MHTTAIGDAFNRKGMIILFGIFLTLTSFNGWALESDASNSKDEQTFTRIIIIRHAPKIVSKKNGDDSIHKSELGLSSEGKRRAEGLANLANEYSVAAIYSTNFKRTKDTVAPLAKKTNLTINLNIKPFDYDNQLNDILQNHSRKTVVIVGHSNTVPGFINHILPERNMPNLEHNAYNDIFFIKYYSSERVELIESTYSVKTTHNLFLKN